MFAILEKFDPVLLGLIVIAAGLVAFSISGSSLTFEPLVQEISTTPPPAN